MVTSPARHRGGGGRRLSRSTVAGPGCYAGQAAIPRPATTLSASPTVLLTISPVNANLYRPLWRCKTLWRRIGQAGTRGHYAASTPTHRYSHRSVIVYIGVQIHA